MSEKPPLRVIEGGRVDPVFTQEQLMELAAAREFVLDEDTVPEGWEEQVDQAQARLLKLEIKHWDFDELAEFCGSLDVWEDPTKTKVVLDVIEEKVKSLKNEDE
jgi:hypothetical protein